MLCFSYFFYAQPTSHSTRDSDPEGSSHPNTSNSQTPSWAQVSLRIQRLQAATRTITEARAEQDQLVSLLRSAGTPWSEIAAATGLRSKGAAQSHWTRRLASGRAPGRPRSEGTPRGIALPTDAAHPLLLRTRAEDALACMETDSIDAIVTDPPYGIGYHGQTWDNGRTSFARDFWQEACRVTKPGGKLLAFGHPRTFHRLAVAVEDGGWRIADSVVWIKAGTPGGGTHLRQAHEQVVVAVKGDASLGLNVDAARIPLAEVDKDSRLDSRGRFPANVSMETEAAAAWGELARYFYSPPDRAAVAHPTVKPASVMEWLVRLVADPDRDEVVLDPFGGTGSTVLAAMRLGIRSVAVERDRHTFRVMESRVADQRNRAQASSR